MTLVRYYPTNRAARPNNFGLARHGQNINELRGAWQPRADVSEREDAYEVVVELPGIERENVNVSYENNVLTIEGEVSFEKDDDAKYYRSERREGKFHRSFRVPEGGVQAESIEAKFSNGLLTLHLPKVAEVLPKKIEITD